MPVWRPGEPPSPITQAVDWAKRLPASVDASTYDMNIAIDARVPYGDVATVLRAVGDAQFGRFFVVVLRHDGQQASVRLGGWSYGSRIQVFVRPAPGAYLVRANVDLPNGCAPALPRDDETKLQTCLGALMQMDPGRCAPGTAIMVQGTPTTPITDILETLLVTRQVADWATLGAPTS
jgi:hypothetical protein